ncbi:MAG: glycosyltransferase [Nanoarchaeota archaeon]
MKIAIVMPAHNEEKRIEKTLEEYGKFFKKKKKEKEINNFEIIVVINNTQDRTEEIAKKMSKKYREIRCLNFKQKGKGFAIIEGFKDALKRDFDLIGFVDADMATTPEGYYALAENIEGYGGIIASRWVRGSVIKTKQSFLRRVLSRGFNLIVRFMFLMPYEDTQCGAKIFRRKVIERVVGELYLTQWAFDINLLYLCKKKEFKIREYPTTWQDRTDSKLDVMKIPIQMFTGVLRLRLINSIFEPLLKQLRVIVHLAHRILK